MGKRSAGNDEPDLAEYDELFKTVARRIREERMAAHLTQAQLAHSADLKPSYMYEVESGEANITLKTLAKVASALHLAPRDLLPAGDQSPISMSDHQRLVAAFVQLVRVVMEIAESHASLRAALAGDPVLNKLVRRQRNELTRPTARGKIRSHRP